MAFLEAYFDESLKPDRSRVVVVAGFVSDIDAWAAFADEWKREVLAYFRIPYFRMKDFRNAQSRVFRHLSKEDRTYLLARVVHMTAKASSFGVACTVDEDEYNAVTSFEYRGRYGTAFTSCFATCIGIIGHLLSKYTNDLHRLSVFLEEGHANTEQAIQMLQGYKDRQTAQDEFDEELFLGGHQGNALVLSGKRDNAPYRLETIAKGSKKSKCPLQVADVLAHSYLCKSQGLADASSRLALGYWEEHVPLYALDLTKEVIESKVRDMESSEVTTQKRKQEAHRLRRSASGFGATVTRTDGGHDVVDTSGLSVDVIEEIFRHTLSWPVASKSKRTDEE